MGDVRIKIVDAYALATLTQTRRRYFAEGHHGVGDRDLIIRIEVDQGVHEFEVDAGIIVHFRDEPAGLGERLEAKREAGIAALSLVVEPLPHEYGGLVVV